MSTPPEPPRGRGTSYSAVALGLWTRQDQAGTCWDPSDGPAGAVRVRVCNWAWIDALRAYILSYPAAEIRRAVKHFGDVESGIPTQCIVSAVYVQHGCYG
jgi:hypothetical protein